MKTTNALELLTELIDKWADVRDTSDDWTEKNLAGEVIEDLVMVENILNG